MRKNILLLLLIVGIAFLSAIAGSYLTRMHFESSLQGAQAVLSFGQLKILRQIKLDLKMGCERQALDRLSFAIDEKKMLIAEYLQTIEDAEFEKYIIKRDPELLNELKKYHINWDKKLLIKGCDKIKSDN